MALIAGFKNADEKKQSQQKQENIYDEFYTTQNWFLQIVTD